MARQGCFLTVSRASCSSLVNLNGIVLRETANTFEVRLASSARLYAISAGGWLFMILLMLAQTSCQAWLDSHLCQFQQDWFKKCFSIWFIFQFAFLAWVFASSGRMRLFLPSAVHKCICVSKRPCVVMLNIPPAAIKLNLLATTLDCPWNRCRETICFHNVT